MLRIRYVLCPHCGSPRDPNLSAACPLCSSRRYPLIGYSYRHEARTLMAMGVVIALLALLAVALGVAAIIYLEQGLAAL